ncbi:MAG TPA: hypothetical protein PLR20_05750 [Syntrophales bacterium]|nr:hypothetical protein [Syntrophales bacterium]HOX94497.1 hypothetical protein [Syntrophales bacterium]HPI57876.1 hypothetical protein [Syntrophales bacterium]HPN24534.1 hypothetical protein [Syntrophales bacterium]HQM28840.1 hypothetical protein [Syntrophales bacterium]
MPRKPVKKKIERLNDSGLTPFQTAHLLAGWHLGGGYPFRDDSERRERWFANRAYLMGLAGKPRLPGVFVTLKADEKPRAYYDYEMPKKRRHDDSD